MYGMGWFVGRCAGGMGGVGGWGVVAASGY